MALKRCFKWWVLLISAQPNCYVYYEQGAWSFCPAVSEDAEHTPVPGSGGRDDMYSAGKPGPTAEESSVPTPGFQHSRQY